MRSTHIKRLQELAFSEKQRQHPDIPIHVIPKPKYSDKNANELTKSIIDFIKLNGGYAVRINVQGQYRESKQPGITGGKWTKSTTAKGTADIHAIHNGLHLSIEIKIAKDSQSPDQKKTQEQVEKAGGVYFIARDFDTFYTFFEAIKKPHEAGL